jgi:signal transduction histidine kinase
MPDSAPITVGSKVRQMPWRSLSLWRRFAAFLLIALVLLGSLSIWVGKTELTQQRELALEEGTHHVRREANGLKAEIAGIAKDLQFLISQETVISRAEGHESRQASVEQLFKSFSEAQGRYDQIRILSLTGQELTRVDLVDGQGIIRERKQLQNKSHRDYFLNSLSLKPYELYVSPLDLNVEHGEIEQPLKPMIRFVTPIVNVAQQSIGLLVLNFRAGEILERIRDRNRLMRGALWLVDINGNYLLAPDRDSEWGWLLGHSRNFSTDFPSAWKVICPTHSVIFEASDFQFTTERLDFESGTAELSVKDNVDAPQLINTISASPIYLISAMSTADVLAPASRTLQRLMLFDMITLGLSIAICLFGAHTIEARIIRTAEIMTSEFQLRELSQKLLTVQESERRKLSRQLHDDLGQIATAIQLDIRSTLKTQLPDNAEKNLKRASHEVEILLQQMQAVATGIRPTVLDDLGLVEALKTHIKLYEERSQVCVDLKCDDDLKFSPQLEETLFRIVQEGLSNVAEHAQTDRTEVRLRVQKDEVLLEIQDWGCGIPRSVLNNTARLGLLGIRERIRLQGGQFELTTRKNHGTRWSIRLPIPTT